MLQFHDNGQEKMGLIWVFFGIFNREISKFMHSNTKLACTTAPSNRISRRLMQRPFDAKTRAVRRRRRAAAADHMSASRRRCFRGVLTSCRTPAYSVYKADGIYSERFQQRVLN